MIQLWLMILTLTSFALPEALMSRYEILETHEFYKDNELIQRPIEAWQSIASLSTVNTDLSLSKICLKYFLQTKDKGLFRVEKFSLHENCLDKGEVLTEISNLRGLQFQRNPSLKITFTHQDFTTTEWNIKFNANSKNVLFISEGSENIPLLKDNTQCLKVLDDCTVEGDSTCHQCESGFLEAPNGCTISPQYCMRGKCGVKGGPACRRGVKFLKKRVLDCRTDTSFAFCNPGSNPVCQGQEVWCH